MRPVFAMLRTSVMQTLRDRGELFSIVALPLILTAVFGTVFSAGGQERAVRVLFVDGTRTADGSVIDDRGAAHAGQVYRLLRAEQAISLEVTSAASARRVLRDGEAAAAVVVPKGFGVTFSDESRSVLAGDAIASAGPPLEVWRNPTSSNGPVIEQLVQGVATRISADARAAVVARGMLVALRNPPARLPATRELYAMAERAWEPTPPVFVDTGSVKASAVRGDGVTASGFEQYSMGFTLMFVLFITFGAAGAILEEREHGTLRRLLVSPISKSQLVAGKTLSVIGLAALQAGILIVFGAVFFQVPWGRSPLALVMVMGSYILAASGLGVLAAALVRSREQLSGLTPLVATGLSMLGGCYWTLDLVPPAMQTAARFTPTGWAMVGLTDIVTRNQGLAAAYTPTAVLLGFAAVTFALGLRYLRFE